MPGNRLGRYVGGLDLSFVEALQHLCLIPHTVRRRLDGEEVSGPAEQGVRVWIGLHDRRSFWRHHGAA